MDEFADLANSTTYTHELMEREASLWGCKLFERRRDADIKAIAARLSVNPHPLPRTTTHSLPLALSHPHFPYVTSSAVL